MERRLRNSYLSQPVYIEQPLRGVVVFSGKDRIDFLQRQTTNDVSQVSADRIITTILTSPAGRILDVLQLTEVPGAEDQTDPNIIGISLPGRAPKDAVYFKSRIFFMDQVKVSDASSEYAHFDLAGQGLQELFGKLGLLNFPESSALVSAQFQGRQLLAFQQNHNLGIGFQLIAPIEQRELIHHTLEGLGALRLSQEQYEILRVEEGIPAVDKELTEEYTPLEVSLEDTISTVKGCYTGQEVIARQMNYDKVTRKMVGIVLAAGAAAGSQLIADGKTVGKITSFVNSPRFGSIALAIVKRPYYQDGIELGIKESGSESKARVVPLPFQA